MLADYIIVGTGINSLVCAAVLARSGSRVLLLERNDKPGGCILTEEVTLPGFQHDVMSSWHPLFVLSPAYAELGHELHDRGLVYLNTDTPTGSVTPEGDSVILSTNRDVNLSNFNQYSAKDGDGYLKSVTAIENSADITFGLLGSELRRFKTLLLVSREIQKRGFQGTTEFFGEAMGSCKDWLESHFESSIIRTLFAPWILHTGLAPDATVSGHMGKLIAFSLESAGMPVVKGGSYELVEAFKKLIEDHGGSIICGVDVDQILITKGRATGVSATDGQEFGSLKGVICNVTPTQLYGRLLNKQLIDKSILKSASQFRYGRADMQIHLALDSPPQWIDPALNAVPMIHVTEGLASISKSISEADSGQLPAQPTIVVGQPTAVDPSRAPEGKSILWLQLQELPKLVLSDAIGEINIPKGGEWTEALRESYADRVIDRLSAVIPELKTQILHRTVLSPRDLEELNMNLVGGDPYSGDCSFDQNFLWRPLKTTRNHETPVRNLYHIGASTHPGPGLGGGSGYQVGKLLS